MSGAARRIGRRLWPGRGRPDAGSAADEGVPPLAGHDAEAGLPYDPAELERRVVWIWGSPRSGSTWLLRQLCFPLSPDPERTTIFRAPGSEAEGEPWRRPFDAIPVDEPLIANHLAPALGDPSDVDGELVPGTINNYRGEVPAYAYSRAYRAVWAPEARRFALLRLYAFEARAREEGISLSADPLLVVKEVSGSHGADLVMGLMPRARLLFLVRDGRDVVDSLMHAYQPGGFLARRQRYSYGTPAERLEGVRWAARLWACNVDATMRAIAAHPPQLTRTVRYEDLLDPAATPIDELYSWLGLQRSERERRQMAAATDFAAIPESERGPMRRDRTARAGGWRENLSAQEHEICDEIMAGRLKRLGYETD